ncbi:unnamed protein product [Adineta steineri]|uniref:Uncharacterized protein n=1 Tax=Adineta steineri TaxID=433720 RepID=A0A815GK27_9BILA|nr:unnamed protein product [Adineta steineri]CAF1592962.1 unnamed protein product [Adineta steineri]
MDYIMIFKAFSQLNKRFSDLIKAYPSRMIDFPAWTSDKSMYLTIMNSERHRIQSIAIRGDRNIDIFLRTCCIDSTFLCLESVTLRDLELKSVLPILSFLQTLPELHRLSLQMEAIAVIGGESLNMTAIYQMLLSFKFLKYLNASTNYRITEDTVFYINVPSISNQETCNLEYLIVDHGIRIDEILSIINHTPKLHHLSLTSLNGGHIPLKDISSRVPKLLELTELIIHDSSLNVEDLESLLTAFGCRLKTLEIQTDSYASFCIDEQWEKLMNTTLSDLNIFGIQFNKQKPADEFDEDEDDEAEIECRIQSSLDFMCDSFWYDNGWTADIYVFTNSVQAVFRRSR